MEAEKERTALLPMLREPGEISEEEEIGIDEAQGMPIEAEQWLNPFVMAILSSVFYILQDRIAKGTSVRSY